MEILARMLADQPVFAERQEPLKMHDIKELTSCLKVKDFAGSE